MKVILFGVILKDETVLDDVLSIAIECGAGKAYLLEGTKLEHLLTYDMPIFMGAFPQHSDRGINRKIVFGFFASNKDMEEFVRILKSEHIGSEKVSVFSTEVKLEIGDIFEWN